MDRMMEDFFGGSGVFGRQGGGSGDQFFRHEPFGGPDAGFWREVSGFAAGDEPFTVLVHIWDFSRRW